MRTRSPVRRIVLSLLALVHLSVPTLATVVHARLARSGASEPTGVHVEDLGQHRSVRTHPESCVFCQLLGRDMLAEAEQAAQAEGAPHTAPPPAIRQDVHSRTATARPSSRAPPAQS
jgi:hypothetical protein